MNDVGQADIDGLRKAELSYGPSWKKRGGVGAFMMLARKWDRLEKQVLRSHNSSGTQVVDCGDIFSHVKVDRRSEGVLDDIRDLRRYLILVEAEMLSCCFNAESNYDANSSRYLEYLPDVAQGDENRLMRLAGCRDGSVFWRLADDWDYLETQCAADGWDVFKAVRGSDHTMECLRRLRVVLLYVEHKLILDGMIEAGSHRDNHTGDPQPSHHYGLDAVTERQELDA